MDHSKNSGLPLGDFKPSHLWQTHVNAIFYGSLGSKIHNHFQTYVSRDYRIAHALAEEFLQKALQSLQDKETLFVHEWGVGNGNLAACFLSHLKSIDTDERVYPLTHYVLCDYSLEILKGVRANPNLAAHAGHFSTVLINAGELKCFRSNSAHKIISNEIWDDMATRVLLKHDGMVYEEFLQPLINPESIPGDFEHFRTLFTDKDLEGLRQLPEFLHTIHWERDFQRVDISDWPYAETLESHLEQLADGIPTPINVGAFHTLEQAREILLPESQGYIGFDYGMLSFQDLNQEGRPYFNLYGGQYTFMVNFELLQKVGENLGYKNIDKEYQHDFIGHHLQEKVASLVEVMQCHPQVPQMDSWDRDVLMLQTLNAINGTYRSPYKNKIEYPPTPGTPKKQRKLIGQLAKKLSPHGVPDTVAYVTEGEVLSAMKPLKKLGYREKGLQMAFHQVPPPVSFVKISFSGPRPQEI